MANKIWSLNFRHSISITHHSSLITHYLYLITHNSLLITHHSSLITHHSSLNFHHSSLITQTLFFPSLKIKHVWFHFLFYVTQNFAGTHLLYWVRRIYLPTRVSSFSSSFSLFLSSLLCLYSPLRPKNFAPLLSFTH